MPSGLGFFKIDRAIRDWKYWGNASIRGFWIYLIEEANWKDGWFGKGVKVPRGSFITSYEAMAEANELSSKTIRKYVQRLVENGQIKVKITNKYTMITVINYSEYQDIIESCRGNETQQSSQQSSQQDSYQGSQQSSHNRRKKERKNLRKEEEYARGASPSDALNSSSSESEEEEMTRQLLLQQLKGQNL